jgi:hypothetical protein
VCEVVCNGLLVGACVDLSQVLGGRDAESENANSALAVAGSVQHTNLQACEGLGHALIDSDLNNVCLIARHCRESAEVAGAVEEVAVESAGPESGCCANTENSLKANLGRKVVAELSGEFDSILSPGGVPSWVEVCLATGVSGKVAQAGHILVLCAEKEHVDRDLRFTALHRETLVEAVLCLQECVLLRSSKQLLVLTHLKLAVANVG